MSDKYEQPQSLLAVTNWRSRALTPSEVYTDAFTKWAHHNAAHLYMVLIGPKTEVDELALDGDHWRLRADHWRLRARFHDGVEMKPRTIRVPFEVLPRDGTALRDGAIDWTDESGTSHRWNAAQVARSVLEHADRLGHDLGPWRENTIRKFFTYQVEYIGQSYGKHGERTAAERIGEGHMRVQQVLAEVADHHPSVAVAVIVMDAHVSGREMMLSVGPNNDDGLAERMQQFMTEPDGPLADQAKLVTAAEAMLIRSFPAARNDQYKDFPVKDAPALICELREAGISHLGVQLDVSRSLACIRHPDADKPAAQILRFAVNLETGARETPRTSAPLAWQAD